jgi:hypothetical protein
MTNQTKAELFSTYSSVLNGGELKREDHMPDDVNHDSLHV